jgi:hypothetical protein
MRTRSMVGAIAVATGLFVTGAVAQHEEHHQDQAAPSDTNKPGGMTPGNVMSQMPQMMMGQNETGKLVDRLMTSFAAVEAEKNPTARKEKLAKHGMLLKELQTNVQAQSHMMEMMQQMMAVSMMDGKMMGGTLTDEHKQ